MTRTLTTPGLNALASGQDWSQAALDWLTNLGSDRTRRAYLEAWNSFLAFTGKDPASVTRSDVLAYRRDLETTPSERTGATVSQATLNQHLSAISSFYRFAVERGLRMDNPADGVKRKAVNPYGKATWMQTDEAKQFLAAVPRNTVQGKRDYALMLLFLTTAVRVGVIANLRFGDFRRQGERVFMTYTNKGGETVESELDPLTVAAIEQCLATRQGLAADSPLFTATDAGRRTSVNTGHGDAERPITVRTIHRLVKKYADRAFGKGHGLHPHSLRHTAAMEAARHGTVSEVSKLLRHKNTRITTIYLDHVDDSSAYRLTETLGKTFAGDG
jgi:integrase/recombinase XerC